MQIFSISSELAPFSKSGGLADVCRSLPKAIKRLGHDVAAITPLYGKLINKTSHNLELIFRDVEVFLNSQDKIKINYWRSYLMDGLPVYFIENKNLFSRSKNLYGTGKDNARFFVFNVACLKLLNLLEARPDVLHCHDWQTGLIPYLIKTKFRYARELTKTKTVFTIHNLIFQFGKNWWEVPPEKKDYTKKKIPHLEDENLEYINFAKRGILSADIISTVSQNYRTEIITKKFGQDLHRILKNREHKLFGIVNGIDYHINPEKDPSLRINYTSESIELKTINKKYIQKKFALPIDENVPMICTTSRVTFQKGFELILKIIHQILGLHIQLVIVGAGDKFYLKNLAKIARKYPHKLLVLPSHEECLQYENLIYAGSDLFLLPSHSEPCGTNQLKAMRFGCVPIVRKIGGLLDTVHNFDKTYNPRGTGFSFRQFNELSLFGTLVRALENYKYKQTWQKLVKRIMRESNSWEIPAKKYLELYQK